MSGFIKENNIIFFFKCCCIIDGIHAVYEIMFVTFNAEALSINTVESQLQP